MRRVGPVANIDKIGTVLLVEHVEPTYTPIQVHHQVIAIIVLGAVQVHAGTRCQVDCGLVARTLSSGTRSFRNTNRYLFLGFIHVYPQILSAPFQNEYCHYIPLHLIIYIPTNIPFHPTNHYIPLHRGKHPMTHGVSPFPAPFPLLLLYLQPRNHIRKRSRNFH